MSEEMKLLKAICNALMFDVIKHVDYKERKESTPPLNRVGDRMFRSHNGAFDIDEDGMYTSYLIEPETSYTVTPIKKKEKVDE